MDGIKPGNQGSDQGQKHHVEKAPPFNKQLWSPAPICSCKVDTLYAASYIHELSYQMWKYLLILLPKNKAHPHWYLSGGKKKTHNK